MGLRYNPFTGNFDFTGGGNSPGTVTSSSGSSTDNAIARFDGTSGTIIQNSSATLDDSGKITISNIVDTGLTASTVPYVDSGNKLVSSIITPTELGYLSGVTSTLQTQLDTKWSLIGNSGTTPGTNFIGTTDSQALVVKTNGTQVAKFTPTQSIQLGPVGSTTIWGDTVHILVPSSNTQSNGLIVQSNEANWVNNGIGAYGFAFIPHDSGGTTRINVSGLNGRSYLYHTNAVDGINDGYFTMGLPWGFMNGGTSIVTFKVSGTTGQTADLVQYSSLSDFGNTVSSVGSGGQYRGPAGTVSIPGFAFNSDTNNGWYAPAADTQAWTESGSEAMRLDSTGLGIGTIASTKLDINGNVRIRGIGVGVVHSDSSGNITSSDVVTSDININADLNVNNNKITNLTSGSNPSDAVNYGQLTALSTGLNWLSPINDPDLVDDSLNTPPVSPVYSITYIIAASGTGAWTGLDGHAVWWDGTQWIDLSTGLLAASGFGTAVQIGDRFAVAIGTPGASAYIGGGLTGKDNYIVTVLNNTPGAFTYTDTIPVNNYAVSVLDSGSQHYGSSYTYNSSLGSWIDFSGPSKVNAGAALAYSGNTLNVLYDNSTIDLTSNKLEVKDGGITNTKINASAAIDLTKLAALSTHNKALQSDNNGFITESSVTNTELGYVSGVTSAIQTQLNNKQATGNYITDLTGEGTASGPGSSVLTLSNSAVIGKVLTGFSSGPSSTVLATDSILIATEKLQAQVTSALGGGITSLTGDVTGSGPGATATTIAKIQGTTVSGTTGTGNVVFSSAATLANPVVGTQSSSDNSTKAASTAYVTTAISNAIAGVNPAVSVSAATTQASDTSGLTYNNGVSGIGATLTSAINTSVIFDGVTFNTLGQRGLVKNDTQSPSGAFNGVYYVTQLPTALLPIILTRALDFDQPSDINNTGAIPVTGGNTQANTTWVQSAQVNTVGTDALIFTKFSNNPATIPVASAGDINETSFTGLINNTANQTITGFAFTNATVRSFRAQVSIALTATSNQYAIYDIYGIQRDSDWQISQSFSGDAITGFIFDITTSGQVRASIGNITGFSSAKIQYRATTTTV